MLSALWHNSHASHVVTLDKLQPDAILPVLHFRFFGAKTGVRWQRWGSLDSAGPKQVPVKTEVISLNRISTSACQWQHVHSG
jgi:hypothetical protein